MMINLVDRVILPRRAPSLRAYVRWGVVSGLAGGLAMAVFLLLVGEPSIRQALVFEAAHAGPEAHDEMFSRGVQVVGGVAASLLYGVALGAIFGVVFARLRKRFLAIGGFGGALRLALIGYLTVVLVPALKYPANPPGVGDPETIGPRTVSFVTLLAASVVITIAADRFWRFLMQRGIAEESRVIGVGALWIVSVGLAYVMWPTNPDPIGESAKLIWHFRLASLGGALALWATLGALFGLIAARTPYGLGPRGEL